MELFMCFPCFRRFNKTLFNIILITPAISFIFFSTDSHAFPRTELDLEKIVESITPTGLGANSLLPLNNQTYITVMEASMSLDDDDPIFIVPYGPDKPLQKRSVLLIPQKIMVWHEVINVIRQDMAVSITYSPASGSLAVYDTKKNGHYLQLQSDGAQYNANSVLFDANTNSRWSQMYGLAFLGTLKGAGLDILPAYWSTWSFVRDFYIDEPETAKVLVTPRSGIRRYGRDPYGSYIDKESYYYNDTLIYPVNHMDTRLPLKTPIIGFEFDNNFLALDLNYVRKKKFVNFFFGTKALLAIYDERLDIIRVFDRAVWNGKNPLIFKLENGNLIDFHTKSSWNFDGECTNGNYLGAYMKEYFGVYAFWFSWVAHNPETSVVPGNTVVPDSALDRGVGADTRGKGLKPKTPEAPKPLF